MRCVNFARGLSGLLLARFFVPLLVTAATGLAAEESVKPFFELSAEVRGQQVAIIGSLHDCLCASVEVTASLQGMSPSLPLPLRRDVTESRGVLLTLRPTDRAKRSSYEYAARFAVGRSGARPTPGYVYRLPFPVPALFRVAQGYGGTFSHEPGSPNEFSVDWTMPVGSTVLAAREGVVVAVRSDQQGGGTAEEFAERVNQVVVEHADGTLAEYLHLRYRGVAVKLGQRVATGDLLGFSGDTGYTNGPQLHVRVYRIGAPGREQSLPVKWDTRERYKPGGPRDEFPFKFDVLQLLPAPAGAAKK